MAATRALLPCQPVTATRALRSRPGAGRKSGLLILIKWLLKSHSIDKLPAWPHRGKPPGIRDEPVRPCHTITVDTGAFSTDGSASILDAALAQARTLLLSAGGGSCRATVLEGRYERIAPANERSYVTADDELLMCQCRAAGDLRLTFPHWQAPARRPSAPRARGVAPPLAPGVTQLIVEMEDARPTPGCRDSMCSCCWKMASDATSPSPMCRSPLRRTLWLRSPRLRSPQRRAPLRRAPRCRAVPRRTSSSAMRPPVRLEFHIRRMPGGVFTDGILPRLAPGDTLTLEGPLGACVWPGDGWRNGAPGSLPDGLPHGSSNGSHNGADHLVLLATGTGFAGVFPILMAALHDRRMASVTLYWGGRTPDDCYAAPLLNALQGKHAGLRWHAALSDDAGTRRRAGRRRRADAIQRIRAAARPGPGAGRRPRLDPQRGLRLRQSDHGARGPRPARRGGPAARPLPVRSLPARDRRRSHRCAAAPRTCLGTRRPALHDGGHPGRAPALPGRRARHRRADPPGHDDARRGQRRRRPSARHGRLAQLASDLCALRRRHAVASRAADGFPARAAG